MTVGRQHPAPSSGFERSPDRRLRFRNPDRCGASDCETASGKVAFQAVESLWRRPGYTLLELVMVMAILCIVAAGVVPMLRNFGRGREAGDAAGQFVSLARWARTQAVASGNVYRLNLDAASKTYWLTARRDSTFDSLGEEMGRTFTFPANVQVDCDFPQRSDGVYVEFEPSGRTDEGNVRLIAPSGEVTQIGCVSTTETFQIIPADQPVSWGVHHTAKFVVGGVNQ